MSDKDDIIDSLITARDNIDAALDAVNNDELTNAINILESMELTEDLVQMLGEFQDHLDEEEEEDDD